MSITLAGRLVWGVVLLTGCAATTPAPRFSAFSPADPDAPEAARPPRLPLLAGEPEAKAEGTVARPRADAAQERQTLPAEHAGHHVAQPAAAAEYSCPMHPDVKQATPGTCPRCGMRLVEHAPAGARP